MLDTIKDLGSLIITISSVLGIFTGIVNKVFTKKLKPINDKIDRNEKKALSDQMNNLRYRVVSFASDLHKGIPKTQFEYSVIFQFANEYEEAVEKLNLSNHLFDEELRYIEECYRELDNSNK